MKKLDQRGTASFEFILCAIPFFFLLFAVFDIGRYAITVQSLQTLADAGARAAMLCSTSLTNFVATRGGTWPSSCTGSSLMTATAMKTVAPVLYWGSDTPTLNAPAPAATDTGLTVTASAVGFQMMIPWWGKSLNNPSVSTIVPFK